MFLLLAANDPIASGNIQLYEKWRDAERYVEMPFLNKGGHRFGIEKRGQPTDTWPDLLRDCMDDLGLLKYK